MLIPFLPMYLLEELHVAQEDVNLWSGLVFSVSFLISGVMAPIWGALADKRSKKMMAVRAFVDQLCVGWHCAKRVAAFGHACISGVCRRALARLSGDFVFERT